MHRRTLLIAGLGVALPAAAHHGWSSFNQDQPLYLEGRLKSVQWRNPHAEGVIEVATGLALPGDLAGRKLPAQSRVPADAAGDWEVEFAPLSRMEAWGVTPLKAGDRVELIGYAGVAGKPRLMRVEYLIVQGRAAGLRSAPQR
jgi:hypothetical protein